MGMAPPPGGPTAGPVPAYNSPEAPQQQPQLARGGMGQGPMMSRPAQQAPSAMSFRGGPDGTQAPMPRTKADLDALMNFVHSGIPAAQERSKQAEAQRQQQLLIQTMLEGGRNNRAEAGNTSKEKMAADTEEGRNARFDKNLFEMHQMHHDQHLDRLASIKQRYDEVAARISAAEKKGGGGELGSLGKELGALESQLKTEMASAEKYNGQATNLMSTAEGRKASADLQAEAVKRAAEVRNAIVMAREKLEAARKKAGQSGGSSTSLTIKSGGGADSVTVIGPDGKPIVMKKK